MSQNGMGVDISLESATEFSRPVLDVEGLLETHAVPYQSSVLAPTLKTKH